MRLGSCGVRGVGAVLSVAKLTLGQEAYYEQQVVRGLDDYYAGRGESPGIWAGQGAAGLELSGVVDDGELGTLLRGVNPASGEPLRKPVRERTITMRSLDLETGEWNEEPKRLAPVSGYDLVFSCPKSVSLLHALTKTSWCAVRSARRTRLRGRRRSPIWSGRRAWFAAAKADSGASTAKGSSRPRISTAPRGRRIRICTRM